MKRAVFRGVFLTGSPEEDAVVHRRKRGDTADCLVTSVK